jgi:hypothetical protein
MKKIEEAARKLFPLRTDESVNNRNGFVLGARYALDAMTSEDAVRAIDRVRILRTSTLEQLAAVRKEIEG